MVYDLSNKGLKQAKKYPKLYRAKVFYLMTTESRKSQEKKTFAKVSGFQGQHHGIEVFKFALNNDIILRRHHSHYPYILER